MSILCLIFGHAWTTAGALAGKLICKRCNDFGARSDYAKAL